METGSEDKPADKAAQKDTVAFPVRCPKKEISDLFLLCSKPTLAAGAGLLTCAVRGGQHDGGDPRDLAIGRVKETLDLFEEDGYAFGEGVGKADRNESTKDHHPAPATVRGAGGWPCVSRGRHGQGTRAQRSSGSPAK